MDEELDPLSSLSSVVGTEPEKDDGNKGLSTTFYIDETDDGHEGLKEDDPTSETTEAPKSVSKL